MELPLPLPPRIECPRCKAVIKIPGPSAVPGNPAGADAIVAAPGQRLPSVAPPAGFAPDIAAEPAPSRGVAGRLLLVAGLLITLGLGLYFTIRMFGSGDVENAKEKPADLTLPKAKETAPDPRIDEAIKKGVVFLNNRLKDKKLTAPEGRIGVQTEAGVAGLIGLALLECGVAPDDPAIERVAEIIRSHAPHLSKIYTLSGSLFFLNRWHEARPLSEKDRQMARTFALRIIAGQFDSGVWGYVGVVQSPEAEEAFLKTVQDGTYKGRPTRHYSISNTQFAMLALWGARRHGVPVREPLLRLADHFHKTQFPDGRWIYSDVDPSTLWTTATCAGLIALALERPLREHTEFVSKQTERDPSARRADVNKAFEYVGRSIGRKKGDPDGGRHRYVGNLFQADSWGDLYYLWTIERLGMIYSMPIIEGKDWYGWGYPLVLDAQHADGSWVDKFQPEVDTCFALLFLRRANLAQDLTVMLQTLGRPGAGKK